MAKDVSLVRIKADTNDYERSIKQAQKTFDSFTKGLGVNISKFTGVGAAIAGVTAALKVAKDAFFNNEEQLDEWGRTVKSAESLYSGFLTALNTGNISGYLKNMSNIVNAAREAYDALDALGTYNAFNQLNMGQARTNLTDAMADFREGSGSKEAVQAAASAYKKELHDRMQLEQNAYEAAVKEVAAKRGVNDADLLKALTGSYGNYETLKNTPLTGSKETIVGMGASARKGTIAVPANETERLGQALRGLNDTELKDLQALGAAAKQTANEIAQTDRQLARILRGNSGSTGGSGGGSSKKEKEKYIPAIGSIDWMQEEVQKLQVAFEKAADEGVRGKLYAELQKAKLVLDTMNEGMAMSISRASSGSLSSQVGGGGLGDLSKIKIEGDDLEKMQELANAGKAAETSWDAALGSISGLGSALASIEDPAVKVLGIIAQAIATVALSFAQALSKDTKLGVFGWIAAAAAGTAAMFSTISAIKSATAGSYADGGIVPGNSFSGDNLTANVNSGELILNRAQQNTLAAQLRQQNSNNKSYQPSYVSGEQIWVAMNRYLKRSGQGEVLTWKS